MYINKMIHIDLNDVLGWINYTVKQQGYDLKKVGLFRNLLTQLINICSQTHSKEEIDSILFQILKERSSGNKTTRTSGDKGINQGDATPVKEPK